MSRQIAELTDLIKRIDSAGEIVDTYVDNDVSAYRGKRRPEFERMRGDVKSGRIAGVASWHIDRLTRRPVELEGLVDLAEQADATFVCLHGFIDLSTPSGRLCARQLGAYARYEIEHRTERLQSANRAAAKNGKAWYGGMRCFGYAANGVDIDTAEAKIIHEVADRLLAGQSMRSVAQDLDRRGIRTTAGNLWNPPALARLLTNPRLTGKRLYKGEVVATDAWPAILTDERQSRLVALLRDPARKISPGSVERTYLLTGGIARCGLCGANLSAQPSNVGTRGYVCRAGMPARGCGRIRIAAEAFEKDVAAEVLARFASPVIRQRLAAASAPHGDTTLAEQITALENRLIDLGEDLGKDLIEKPAFYAAQGVIKDGLADLRAKVRQAERLSDMPTGGTPESLAVWWRAAGIERRRALIQVVLDHVLVNPTKRKGFRGFDKERLAYIWR